MSKTTVGLNIGSTSLKFVELIHKRGKYKLSKIGVEEFPLSEKQGYMSQQSLIVKSIQKVIRSYRLNSKRIVTGVEGESVVVRTIRVPKMKKRELEEAIRWKAEEHIPYPAEDAFLGYHVLKRDLTAPTGTEMAVMVVGVRKDTIERYLDIFRQANLCPAIVDANSLALYNIFEKINREREKNIAVINIGHKITNFVIVAEGSPFLVRDIKFGGESVTQGLIRALGVNYSQAENIKKACSLTGMSKKEKIEAKLSEEEMNQILYSALEDLIKEIVHSFEYFTSNKEGGVVQKIVISGGTSLIKNIDKIISSELGIPVQRMTPFSDVIYQKGKSEDVFVRSSPLFAVATGLALREISLI